VTITYTCSSSLYFVFNDTATTEIYTLSLHDALPIDSHCRGYVSQLNKIEIYLQHTPTDLDRQKANDLRKLIKIECGKQVLSQKHDDWQCKRYRTDLTKAEIFHEHTPTPRDEQKIKDLKKQIAHECE